MRGEQDKPNKTGLGLPAFLPLPWWSPHRLPGRQRVSTMRVQGWSQEASVQVLAWHPIHVHIDSGQFSYLYSMVVVVQGTAEIKTILVFS